MSIITDELVEKAWDAFERVAPMDGAMQAALTAILPDIIEACAKVADEYAADSRAYGDVYDADGYELVADAIRSLSQGNLA